MTSRERPGATAYPRGRGYPSCFPMMSRCPVDPCRHAVEEGTGLDDRGRPRRGHETFTLRLSNPQKATLGDAAGTGTIEDDDPPLTAIERTGRARRRRVRLPLRLLRGARAHLLHDAQGGTSASARCSRPSGRTGSNQAWKITIGPDGVQDVAVELPASSGWSGRGSAPTTTAGDELALGDRPRSGRRFGLRRAVRGGRRRRARSRGEPPPAGGGHPHRRTTPRRTATRSPGSTIPAAAPACAFRAHGGRARGRAGRVASRRAALRPASTPASPVAGCAAAWPARWGPARYRACSAVGAAARCRPWPG